MEQLERINIELIKEKAMDEKAIWVLKDEEVYVIEELFEKKIALENLIKILEPYNQELYEKVLIDYGKVCLQYNDWWNHMKIAYQWPGDQWRINFSTHEVYIM